MCHSKFLLSQTVRYFVAFDSIFVTNLQRVLSKIIGKVLCLQIDDFLAKNHYLLAYAFRSCFHSSNDNSETSVNDRTFSFTVYAILRTSIWSS